jgi:hypothetical protein
MHTEAKPVDEDDEPYDWTEYVALRDDIDTEEATSHA